MDNFRIENEDRGTIVYVKGALMLSDVAYEFQDLVTEAGERESKNLIIDFSEVNLIGSLFIGQLVRSQAHFDKIDGKIGFVNFTKPVKEVLTMTRVNSILNIYDSLEDANRIFQ